MTDWTPSLYALRAFEAVARHLSYKAAAEELNVTPAAVKQLVVKLERAIGTSLIERKGHTLVLTANGLAGQSDLTQAMRHLSDAVQKMRDHRREGRLIISVEASLATTWLVPRLERFRAACPGIDVLIDSSQRIVDLRREDVDVAIRYGVQPDESLRTTRLFEDLVFPACSPRLLAGRQELESATDLDRMSLIHWDLSQMPWAQNTQRWFEWGTWAAHLGAPGIDVSKGPRFTDYGLAVQAAISGQGILLAGWPALQDPMEAGLLVCPFPDHVQRTDIGFDVVTTVEAARKPEVTAFTDWLMGLCAEGSRVMPLSRSRG